MPTPPAITNAPVVVDIELAVDEAVNVPVELKVHPLKVEVVVPEVVSTILYPIRIPSALTSI